MNAVPVTETLDHLRRTLAQIDPARRSANASGPLLSLRVAAIDDALGGGLAPATDVHAVMPRGRNFH